MFLKLGDCRDESGEGPRWGLSIEPLFSTGKRANDAAFEHLRSGWHWQGGNSHLARGTEVGFLSFFVSFVRSLVTTWSQGTGPRPSPKGEWYQVSRVLLGSLKGVSPSDWHAGPIQIVALKSRCLKAHSWAVGGKISRMTSRCRSGQAEHLKTVAQEPSLGPAPSLEIASASPEMEQERTRCVWRCLQRCGGLGRDASLYLSGLQAVQGREKKKSVSCTLSLYRKYMFAIRICFWFILSAKAISARVHIQM